MTAAMSTGGKEAIACGVAVAPLPASDPLSFWPAGAAEMGEAGEGRGPEER